MNSFHAERGLDLLSPKSQDAYQVALNAAERGWSVIPLLGGKHPTYGKRPRIRWQAFTQHSACEQKICKWFEDKPSAYAVVCGKVSKLIVLDFDEADTQAEFMQKYPHLLNTYLVRSGLRGTLHIYLQVDFVVKSCKLRGGDLKAEGSYVVGAGSEIAGGQWQVVQDKPLYQISESEFNQVLADFANPQKQIPSNSRLVQSAKSPDDFRNIYRFLVKEYGKRNEALFRVGCLMRDASYGLEDCIEALANLHAAQAAVSKHSPETEAQRWAEAERSLRSVFSKPARRQRAEGLFKQDASYLPNSLREAILVHGDGIAFLRVYEGLRLLGVTVGEWLTEGEIRGLLAGYGVGRASVRKALGFGIEIREAAANADLSLAIRHTKTCVFVPKTKADKSPHRPARYYLIPSVDSLCELFGIHSNGSDPIELKDIKTAKHYRAALNRELIRRRPGKYSQAWLSQRLGVCSKSIQRYLKLENIKSRQILQESPLHWNNFNQLPTTYSAKRAGLNIRPFFLQDEQGKRYPAKPELAKKLLKSGHRVSLMQRDCKEYWLEEETKPVSLQEKFAPKKFVEERRFAFPEYPSPFKIVAQTTSPMAGEIIPELEQKLNAAPVDRRVYVQKQKPSQPEDLDYKVPLPDKSHEWLAKKVYKAAGNLQLIEARQVVHLYGKKAVGQALGRMEHLAEAGEMDNPAGFLKVASRVAWRAQAGFGEEAPKYVAPKRRTRFEQSMVQSQ